MDKALTEYSISNEKDKKGEELTVQNPFFNDLVALMEDEKFSSFFNTYFKNMDDIKATVIYMKLYQLLQKRFKNVTDKKLSCYTTIFILHQIMTNGKIRPKILEETMKHLQDPSHPLFNLTPKRIKNPKKKKFKNID